MQGGRPSYDHIARVHMVLGTCELAKPSTRRSSTQDQNRKVHVATELRKRNLGATSFTLH